MDKAKKQGGCGDSVLYRYIMKKGVRTITFRGKTHTLSEWAVLTGINSDAIRRRLRKGWSLTKTLTTPIWNK